MLVTVVKMDWIRAVVFMQIMVVPQVNVSDWLRIIIKAEASVLGEGKGVTLNWGRILMTGAFILRVVVTRQCLGCVAVGVGGDEVGGKKRQGLSFRDLECMLGILTSFAGHLAGILVGLMYTQGPLKKIMETCAGIFSPNQYYPGQQYYFNSSGHSGYQNHYAYGRPGYSEVPRNYDVYTAGLSEEEQLERALRASLWDRGNTRNSPPSYGFRLSPEEMRRQRLHRFDGQ
ncbi:Rhomboid-related protein 4 [Sciurus carolinensis]|uniref:Rhomboid-related protein 4 n=1 Tax=Sciurus carolinensis TaxID=30640 RepID=A0AA41N077_SCICA|nr:Rhomboid-related protein 4 [Sciurus carolinensis]